MHKKEKNIVIESVYQLHTMYKYISILRDKLDLDSHAACKLIFENKDLWIKYLKSI